jgi:hypothetical protein
MQQSSLQLPTLGNKIFSLRNQGFSIIPRSQKPLGKTLLRIEQKPRDCNFSSQSEWFKTELTDSRHAQIGDDRSARENLRNQKFLCNGGTREQSCAEDAAASRSFCLCTLFDGRDATTYTLRISPQIYIYYRIKQSYW